MIDVLIVDDSPTIREYFSYFLGEDKEINIIGKLPNGKMAVEFVKTQKPDIITMDVDMPVMNGMEATRQIMASTPVPIIVITASRNAKNEAITMEALASGALTVLEKPAGLNSANTQETMRLITLVKTYSKVKVIRRRYAPKINTKSTSPHLGSFNSPPQSAVSGKKFIVIGVSTGGPEVLKKILENLDNNFPLPILIVQHITAGFLSSMVNWLNSKTKLSVQIGKAGEKLLPGHVYFAPDSYHMQYGTNSIQIKDKCEEKTICPSVDSLFKSMTKHASNTIALLLTGMGNDGALALKQLKEAGALTIAQDKKSALVHGMPGEAIKLNAANYVLNTEQIIETLQKVNKRIN